MTSPLGFGELEAPIMDVMWAAERPLMGREVRERLCYGRPVAYTTVMTVMNVLHRKGVLKREKRGRPWRYWPAVPLVEYVAQIMSGLLVASPDPARTIELAVGKLFEPPAESRECEGVNAPP